MADMLFCPLKEHARECERSCDALVKHVGNTIADVLDPDLTYSVGIDKKTEKKEYVVVTLHRPELVDHPDRLWKVLTAISLSVGKSKVIFPVHPRTKKTLEGLAVKPEFEYIDPVPAWKMWKMIKEANVVFTDSGGIQEECCILGTPAWTMRDNTERPETLGCGSNFLVPPSLSLDDMLKEMAKREWPKLWDHPYGKNVAAQIIATVFEYLGESHD